MTSDPLIGQTLGNYEVLHRLGKGGMATVYRARQLNMARDVAIKIMSVDLAEDPKFVARFEQEARVIANLQHPRILPVHDFGHEGEVCYLVMRVIDGESLYQRMQNGPLPLMTAAKFLSQIAEALDYAHSQSVIHRDLKPNNVLIDEWDNCYLMDFGLAKMLAATQSLTQTGAVLGTPAYMAPEQWRGESVDARTDVYALGVILYEMVLGHPPFESDTPFTLMYKHINDAPPRPSDEIPNMPDEIEAVILKALAKDRAARYQSAGELAHEFMSVARVAGSLVVRERQEETLEGTDSAEKADAATPSDAAESPRAAGEVTGPSGSVGEVAAPNADSASADPASPSEPVSAARDEAESDQAQPAEKPIEEPIKSHRASATPIPFPLVEDFVLPPSEIVPPPPPIPLAPGQHQSVSEIRGTPVGPVVKPSTPGPSSSSRFQRALEVMDHSVEAVAEKAIEAVPVKYGTLEPGEPPASAVPVNAPAFHEVSGLIPASDPLVGVLDVRGTGQWKTWKNMLIGGVVLFFFGGIVNAGFLSFLGLILLAYVGFQSFRTYRGDIGRYYLGFTPQRVIVLPRDVSGRPQSSDAWVVGWNMVERLRLTDRYVLLDIIANDIMLNFAALVPSQGDGGLGDQSRWLPDSPVVQLIEDRGYETRNV